MHKLFKTIRQVEKVASNVSLYSHTKKWNFFKQEKCKITKWEHVFKGFASTYNVENLIFLTLNYNCN